ncbi:peptidoglycan/LPS O-acetylase OafA/YrhL [Luteibacter sp. 1214]|uniref:acyltransferase family protein n=1 Tax=Luteibacter sp. 1214 TaxID=2817735 RepID=UPI002864D701|nr:acyltransferase [Luteibacter sp. 1214]MDR6641219.1 peptidoglycan/LPS O-acetylase OafA/YrhL [Luteibacter sp. 1214]
MQARPRVQLDFIDALRGVAIIGVLLSHAQRNVEMYQAMGHQASMSGWLSRYAAQGARGVQLFFVVSALTLFLSAGKRGGESHEWLNFYIRRFFRIAPMFYIAFGVYCLAPVVMKGQALPPPGTLLGTLGFINGWNPAWLLGANDVVPGGWSIGVEMSFYIVFPLVFLALRDFPKAFAALCVILLIDVLTWPALVAHPPIADGDLWERFVFVWLPNQLPIFLCGICAYFILFGQTGALTRFFHEGNRRANAALFALGVLTLLVVPQLTDDPRAVFLYGLAFGLITLCLYRQPYRWLVTVPMRHIGKISFSGYLVHFFMLQVARKLLARVHAGDHLSPDMYFGATVVVALAGTVVLATITYHLVEVPGQALGKRLIQRLAARRAPAPDRATVPRT